MKFTPLPEEQFWIEYKKGFAEIDVPTVEDKERVRNRISGMQQALINHLSPFFEEHDDFAIGWDFNYSYHVCGGVYSDSAISPKLLEGILGALSTDAEPNVWTFHAAVETDTTNGQFYVRNGEVVFPSDGPDFSKSLQ